eukprot:TRINITY_DN12106_c0_g1_i1.p1 TRINITY_DN12106_c0_g1~~TRINITY_DN12106_c0_g1_i1.p1  ORF type:complete len:245 (+),score=43.27 TRINITY_DN12106_c0_g1_i1:82-816(+)
MIRKLLFNFGRAIRETGQALDRVGSRTQGNFSFVGPVSRRTRVLPLYNQIPKIGSEAFVASSASLIGDVELGNNATIWYGAILRGDVNPIKVGSETSILDGAIVHSRSNKAIKPGLPTLIGNNVTIGPGSVIHACTISDNSLIDLGSTILDGAVIESFSVVGPGSLVLSDTHIPSKQYWQGSPAKYVRDVTDQEIKFIQESTKNHQRLAKQHDAAYPELGRSEQIAKSPSSQLPLVTGADPQPV